MAVIARHRETLTTRYVESVTTLTAYLHEGGYIGLTLSCGSMSSDVNCDVASLRRFCAAVLAMTEPAAATVPAPIVPPGWSYADTETVA